MGRRWSVPAAESRDPVEGGVDNDYVWPTDPVGKNDLTGTREGSMIPSSSEDVSWATALEVGITALLFLIPGGAVAVRAVRGVTLAVWAVSIARGISTPAYRTASVVLVAAKPGPFRAIERTFERGSFGSPQASFLYHYGKHGAAAGKSPLRYLAEARSARVKLGGVPGPYRG